MGQEIGDGNAYSIAHRPIRLNGEETNLIFIVVRGSVTVNEFIGDHYAEANRDVLGYTAYDYVEDFEKKVWEDVKKYARQDLQTVFLSPVRTVQLSLLPILLSMH